MTERHSSLPFQDREPVDDHVVLVIEDDSDVRDAICAALEDAGWKACGTANGLEALEYLRGAPVPPCLILMDLNMPVMDGWAFSDTRRRDPALARIPLVVISATAGQSRPAPYVGIAAVIAKPFQPEALVATVAALTPNDARSSRPQVQRSKV
jgi:CheY-like chemotaxis protein